MNRKEFQDALRKGLGRAVRYVQSSPPETVRDDLLYASLNSVAYDPQCEDSRAPWLLRMIDATGEPEYYRRQILDKFAAHPRDDWDVHHHYYLLFDLVTEFASRGDKEAREFLYQRFDEEFNDESLDHEYKIIELDGITGLLYILAQTGQRIRDGFGFWNGKYITESLEEKWGKEKVQSAIQEEAKKNELIQVYLDRAACGDPYFDLQVDEDVQHHHKLTFCELIDRIMDDDFADITPDEESPYPYHNLDNRRRHIVHESFHASQENLVYAFEKLFETDDPRRQYSLLGAFLEHPMPRIETKIIDFLDSDNRSLCWSVTLALSKMNHELLHKKALELLQSDPSNSNWYAGIELLVNNFRYGDQEIIEQALQTKEFPDYSAFSDYDNSGEQHSAGLGVLGLIRNYPDESFEKLCYWFYDQTPCSVCRRKFVEHLITKQSVSSELLEECLNDSDRETRKLAQTALDKIIRCAK